MFLCIQMLLFHISVVIYYVFYCCCVADVIIIKILCVYHLLRYDLEIRYMLRY